MEGVSASVYKGFKGYWRRKDYERLDASDRRRKNRVELVETSNNNGSSSNRRRRFSWRIKITPKLRTFFHLSSRSKKVIKGFRDAYVKMMVSFAKSRVFINGFGGGGGLGSSVGYGLGKPYQYDEKGLIEIYKSLIAQGQLMAVSRDAGILS